MDNKEHLVKNGMHYLLIGIMAIPLFVYMAIICNYATNIPFWDDFTVFLRPIAEILSTGNKGEQIFAAFRSSGGHIPLITRAIAFLQVETSGVIDFRKLVIWGNLGWPATTVMLLLYFHKKLQLTLPYLLPIPFLMLNINHWESMDFATPAWQMYWGSAFFPVLCLIALAERKMAICAIAFIAALYLSSGGLALYPLVILFCCFHKRWENALSFIVSSATPLLLFFFFNPPANNANVLPPVIGAIRYLLSFMGNLVSVGLWDLTPLSWIQIPLGALVLLAGAYMIFRIQIDHATKMIFFYCLVLSGMAMYLRFAIFPYTVSRYAMFASLALTMIYAGFAYKAQLEKWKAFPSVCMAIATLLWVQSIYVNRAPLQLNHDARLIGIQAYIQTDKDPASFPQIIWDYAAYGQPIIEQAKNARIYDPAVIMQTP